MVIGKIWSIHLEITWPVELITTGKIRDGTIPNYSEGLSPETEDNYNKAHYL